MKRFTINIPEGLHKRLKIASTLDGKDMTSVVIKMVEEYVAKIEKRKLIVLQTKR
jgi:hypothetical protein